MSGADQLLERTRLLLPIALLVTAAAVQTYAGPSLVLVATAALSGLALGVFLQLLLRAFVVLLGQSAHRAGSQQLARVEREMAAVAGAMSELELDRTLQRLDAEEAAEQLDELRARHTELEDERRIALSSARDPIESEIERRLADAGEEGGDEG